jgi:uncharacterized membrane protein YbhN (UPF0104 family)
MSLAQPSNLASYAPELGGPRTDPHRPWQRSWIGPALRLAVSVTLVAVVCRRIDAAGLARQFVTQSPVWLIVSALATLAQIGIAAMRWRETLLGLRVATPSGTALAVTYMASFFNCWLLGTMGGDAARALLAPAGERGRATIVHSVLLDRVMTFAGMGLVILPLAVFGVGPLARSLPLIVSLVVALLPLVLLPVLAPMSNLISGYRMPFAGLLLGLAGSWRQLCSERGRLAAALALATISTLAISATAWCLGRAQNLDVTFVDFLMLMPPVVLLSGLPISVGGWGVREGAMIAALATVGVGASAAAMLSIQMGLLVAVLSLPGGALWLWRQLSSVRALATAPSNTAEIAIPQGPA